MAENTFEGNRFVSFSRLSSVADADVVHLSADDCIIAQNMRRGRRLASVSKTLASAAVMYRSVRHCTDLLLLQEYEQMRVSRFHVAENVGTP